MTTIRNDVTVTKLNSTTQTNNTNEVSTNAKNVFPTTTGSTDTTTNFKNKALKAHELDYSDFPKANRGDAAQFAERSLNEVKDLARTFNADFPDAQYQINYSDFPRPEQFPKKNYGGKEEAYGAWKNAVTEWVEDCKQDMNTLRNTNLAELGATLDMYMDEVNKKLDQGFFNMYLQEGVTRDFIIQTYQDLKGDINAVNIALNKKAAEIRAQIVKTGQEIIANDNNNTAGIHNHIRIDGQITRGALEAVGELIREDVRAEGNATRHTVRSESSYTRHTVRAEADKTQEINALSDAISSAINNTDDTRAESTVKSVEQLKSRIVSSQRITHDEKLKLLTKLRNLVIEDDWITSKDLGNILIEARRIAL